MNTYTLGIARALLALILVVGILVPVAANADDGYLGPVFDGGFSGDVFDGGGFYGDAYDGGYYGDIYDGGYSGDSYDGGFYGDEFGGGTGQYYDDVSGTYYDDASGTYYDDATGTYYDDATGTYYDDCYGCGGSYGGGSFGGYSYSAGCGYFCGGGSYTTPGCTGCGGVKYPPITVSNPKYPTPPTYIPTPSTPSNTTVVNNNTNTNTNINNVSATAIAIVPATPQYQTVYMPPTYVAPAPYCTIYHAQASGYGTNAAYLSWTSTNATSGYLSNVGSVANNGTQTVWPTVTTTYTLTVYGQNGQTATCSTTVYAQTYTTPYVSLTQIPYTGFDLGPIGNTMYFVGLAAFAAAAAYLCVYYRGGALAFAGAMIPARKQYAPIVPAKAPILVEREAVAAAVHPVISEMRERGVKDTMAIVQSNNGSMPRIVIHRN